MNTETTKPATAPYNTLDEIRQRKEELIGAIEQEGEQIGTLWNQLFVKREDTSKGEYIAALVANSITAVDAFLLVRKMLKRYGGIAQLFTFKSKKKGKR